MTQLAERVLKLLGKFPKSRYELQAELGVYNKKGIGVCPSERDVRRAIAELRDLGYNIASSSDTQGYWLGDEADKERTIKELKSRAMKLLKTADALEKGPDIGQVNMEV